MNQRISVLIVDDSAVMRKRVSSLLESCDMFTVIAKARNGIDALEKIGRLKPDVILLDIDMPEMNGLDTLKTIMTECPTPIVMLSVDSEDTIQAFEWGAVDFIVKNELDVEWDPDKTRSFQQRIVIASQAKIEGIEQQAVEKEEIITPELGIASSKELVVIGTSTGGPAALQKLLPQFPKDFPLPVLVVQHMPVGFTGPLAERLNQLCHVSVKEAEQGERLVPGTVTIAPAGWQASVNRDENGLFIQLSKKATVDSLYKPSVDAALLSAAPIVGSQLVSVILTGMGDDGLRGCMKVKSFGGVVLAEAESSCIIYSMPKVVTEAGIVDIQAPLQQIFEKIIEVL